MDALMDVAFLLQTFSALSMIAGGDHTSDPGNVVETLSQSI